MFHTMFPKTKDADIPSIRLPEVLPPEILTDILSKIDTVSLITRVALLDHSLREFTTSEYILGNRRKRHFSQAFPGAEDETDQLSLFRKAYQKQYIAKTLPTRQWCSLLKDGDLYRIKQLDLNIADIFAELTKYEKGCIFEWVRPHQYLRDYLFEEIYLHYFNNSTDTQVSGYYLEHVIGMLGPSYETVERLIPDFKVTELRPDQHGNSPLLYAAERHLFETCDALLNLGVPIDWQRNESSSVLYAMAEQGEADVVEFLIKQGANKDLKFREEFTPVYIAALHGHLNTVKILLELGADPEIACPSGSTPMYIAAQEGHAAIIQLLYQYGAIQSVNHLPLRGEYTPLYVACRNGHQEAVIAMLGLGAEVKAHDGDGSTPLYVSAQNGHHDIVRILLNAGADIEAGFLGGYTPLYISVQNGYIQVVQILLEFGAIADNPSPNSSTELYVASQNGHEKIVDLLLSAAASPQLTYSHGYTPLYVAAQNGHLGVARRLLEDERTNFDQQTERGATPIYVAAQRNHAAMVSLLLEKGADPRIQFGNGYNALHIASAENRLDTVKILAEAYPELLDAVDNQERKPIDTAAKSSSVYQYLQSAQQEKDEKPHRKSRIHQQDLVSKRIPCVHLTVAAG